MRQPSLDPEAYGHTEEIHDEDHVREMEAEERKAKTLEQTPEALDWKPDQRDATPEPPALLNPWSVRYMRRMIQDAMENGYRPWPYRMAL